MEKIFKFALIFFVSNNVFCNPLKKAILSLGLGAMGSTMAIASSKLFAKFREERIRRTTDASDIDLRKPNDLVMEARIPAYLATAYLFAKHSNLKGKFVIAGLVAPFVVQYEYNKYKKGKDKEFLDCIFPIYRN